MDIDTIRVFVEVVRLGSFSAAARGRDAAPSSIARAISALEEELGVRLIERTTRRLTLTESGELYHASVQPLMDELEQARDAAVSIVRRPAGLLRMTASHGFGYAVIGPLIPQFRRAHPELKVELVLSDSNLDLVAERIDLALRLGPMADGLLVGAKLFTTRYRVCASDTYLRGSKPLRAPEELSTRRCVLLSMPGFRSLWRFRRSDNGEIQEVPVNGDLLNSNILAVRDWAVAGLGPALLPHWLVEKDLRAGKLRDVFPRHRVTATNFEAGAWLLYPSRAYLPAKVRAMIDFLKQHVTRHPRQFSIN